MSNVRAARRYALALIEAAGSRRDTEAASADLAVVGSALRASREFRLLLESPIVSPQKKQAILRDLFAQRVAQETLSFLEFLVAKRREALLSDIIEQFEALRDERAGILNADVTSAIAFTPSQQQALQAQLEQYTRKKVRTRFALDPTVKGGIVVTIGDTVLDASLRHQLERLRDRFQNVDSPKN